MFYQIEQVLDKQQIEIENFYKGRGILICVSQNNLYALKEFHGKTPKAQSLYDLGAYLWEHGVSCDYMIKNKEEELITEGIDGIGYTFHRWVKARECDVKIRADVVRAASFMARYHETMTQYPVSDRPSECHTILEEYIRRDRQLRRTRKYILKRHDKTDFERLYLACFPEYIRQSDAVLEYLTAHSGIEKEHSMTICHGDYNQHNVVIDSSGMTLLNLEHARYAPQVSDLGNYIRKIMEKHGWNETLGLEMLREYAKIRTMTDADWQELYCRLCYPEKFRKIAAHYINASKVFDSGINYDKLHKEFKQNTARQRFLEVLKRTRKL